MITALEQLQHLKVIALDVDVLGDVPVHTVGLIGAKRSGGRGLCLTDSICLAGPGERIALLPLIDIIAEDKAQFLEVNGAVALDGYLWKKGL